jgi:hypothetical protein
MKDRYPADKLVYNICNPNTNKDVKACLMRLLTYIYIDDDAHSMIRYARCYRAYISNEESIRNSIHTTTDEIKNEDFD